MAELHALAGACHCGAIRVLYRTRFPLGELRVPLTLVRGADSPVVSDDDVAEVLRRRPDTRVVVVDGAGHSVQGDRPIELAATLNDLLDG